MEQITQTDIWNNTPYQNLPYCYDLFRFKRLQTLEVNIGDVPLGGSNPIRLQSMTISDTMNTEATVKESIRMIEAGCEYIRITTPSRNEAENLKNIKSELRKRGYNTPLVADVHFTPNAAEIAARLVEKVRINPGNFADKKKFEFIEYTHYEYEAELERIRQKFSPLVSICKEYGTALRIGVNHGSLSDRIMSHYGDTPLGMVQSALEFIDICEDNNYYQIVISMKASNPVVMVAAYRLLVAKLIERGKEIYPLHLGVTEAGEGQDGRVKSALGIGALLTDGIGDTIRVSLTEPPEYEIPVAYAIREHFAHYLYSNPNIQNDLENRLIYDPYSPQRQNHTPIGNFGGSEVPRVIADLSAEETDEAKLSQIGYNFSAILDKWNTTDLGADYIYCGDRLLQFMPPMGVKIIYNYQTWEHIADKANSFPYFDNFQNFDAYQNKSEILNFVVINDANLQDLKKWTQLGTKIVAIFITKAETDNIHDYRKKYFEWRYNDFAFPVVYKVGLSIPTDNGKVSGNSDEAQAQIAVACHLSGALSDGFIDGVWLYNDDDIKNKEQIILPNQILNQLAFNVLQAARLRITKTEYISCPSCGRTLFDLQETTAMIRSKTEHLKGIKIAVMGCIVNGPGEMADADYGYVGAGVDTISLYKGKTMIEKAIKTEFAVDKLIEIIRQDGNWIEPTTLEN